MNNKRVFFRSFAFSGDRITDIYAFAAGIIALVVSYALNAESSARVILILVSCALLAYRLAIEGISEARDGNPVNDYFLVLFASLLLVLSGRYYAAALACLLIHLEKVWVGNRVDSAKLSLAGLSEVKNLRVMRETSSGELKAVRPGSVPAGALIHVGKGEYVPIDGVLVSDYATISRNFYGKHCQDLTLSSGAEILSGYVNESAEDIIIRTTETHVGSVLTRYLSSVSSASSYQSPYQVKLEKILSRCSVILSVIAVGLLIRCLTDPDNASAYLSQSAVLCLIACSSSLINAITFLLSYSVNKSALNGIFFDSTENLIKLFFTKTLVLSKNGVLIGDEYTVSAICPEEGISKDTLVSLVARANLSSHHPIADALRCFCDMPGISSEGVNYAEEHDGIGITAEIGGIEVIAGTAKFLSDYNITCRVPSDPGTAVHAAFNGKYAGYIMLSCRTRPEAADALEQFRGNGVTKTALLTGDVLSAAKPLAAALGINMMKSELDTASKVESIEYLKEGTGKNYFTGYISSSPEDEELFDAADIGILFNNIEKDPDHSVVIPDNHLSTAALAYGISKKTVLTGAIFAASFLILKLICLTGILLGSSSPALVIVFNSLLAFGMFAAVLKTQ